MGKISKSGIASGTSGSETISLENSIAPSNNSAITKINETIEYQEEMAKILDEAGVKKYNKDDLLFVTNDKSGMLVFLEKGNSKAGLEHIINGEHINSTKGHINDFVKKHHIPQQNLKQHIYNVITEGELFLSKKVKRGYDRIYIYKNKYYMSSGIGTNGFLATCYPINKKRALQMKEKFKNEEK